MPGPPDPALPQADLHLLSPPECACRLCPQAGDTGQPTRRQGLLASFSQYSLQRLNVKLPPPAPLPTGPGRTCPVVSPPPKRVPSCLWDDGEPFFRMTLCYLHRDISKKHGDQHFWPLQPTQQKRLLRVFFLRQHPRPPTRAECLSFPGYLLFSAPVPNPDVSRGPWGRFLLPKSIYLPLCLTS